MVPRTIATLLAASVLVGPGAGVDAPATPAPGDPVPDGAVGLIHEWQLVFEDQFADPHLDPSSWAPCYWWADHGCTNAANDELQWYTPQGVELHDGTLLLQAEQDDVVGDDGQTFAYRSGMVSGMNRDGPRRVFTYGYFEMRGRVPAGRGLWPAFWLLPASEESEPEIDVMEVAGHEPDMVDLHYHWRDAQGDSHSVGQLRHVADLSVGWHTFAVHWAPERLEWYVDGQLQWTLGDDQVPLPHEPMYLLLTLAVGGDYAGPPDEHTEFPATFAIDYVRVWRER